MLARFLEVPLSRPPHSRRARGQTAGQAVYEAVTWSGTDSVAPDLAGTYAEAGGRSRYRASRGPGTLISGLLIDTRIDSLERSSEAYPMQPVKGRGRVEDARLGLQGGRPEEEVRNQSTAVRYRIRRCAAAPPEGEACSATPVPSVVPVTPIGGRS